MISHLAAMLPVGCGISYIKKINNSKDIAVAFIGDGATSEGDFHESLNLAAVWKLPIIFLIENNGYGLSTPTSEQYACDNLADRGIGYGVKSHTIDGNNILEVYDTISKSAEYCRSNKGPVLIEAKTFRMRGHEEASGVSYVPKSLISQWQKKDPVQLFEKYLLDKKILTKSSIVKITNEIKKSFEDDIEYALNKNLEKTNVENELSDVYEEYIPVKYPKNS